MVLKVAGQRTSQFFSGSAGLSEFKIGGYEFYVHKNDPDKLPLHPHAHIVRTLQPL